MAADIDVLNALERFARELDACPSEGRREFILAILRRWQEDSDLNEPSRRRAREILGRFTKPVEI